MSDRRTRRSPTHIARRTAFARRSRGGTNTSQTLDFLSFGEKPIPMLRFDLRPSAFFPTFHKTEYLTKTEREREQARRGSAGRGAADDDRLSRKRLWQQFGRPMHILTLEFESDEFESQFVYDYLRRNKRFVEYGSLICGLLISLMCISLWHSNGYFAEAANQLVIPCLLVYCMIVLFRDAFYAHSQSILTVAGVLSIAAIALWCGYAQPVGLPSYSIYTLSYEMYSEDGAQTPEQTGDAYSITIAMVTFATIFRLRFIYQLYLSVFALAMLNGTYLYMSRAVQCECLPPGARLGDFKAPAFDSVSSKDAAASCTSELQAMKCFHDLTRFGIYPQYMPENNFTNLVVMLLLIQSYVFEVLQRKDFAQAIQVFKESRRCEGLLENILPPFVIEQMKLADATGGVRKIANTYEHCTVFFADVVSFTTMSAQVTPDQLVALLNSMFESFDAIAEKNGVEKIKTIGDCYMAATGVPLRNQWHAHAMCRFALQLLKVVADGKFRSPATNEPIRLRCGVHSGKCVAGVVGSTKFAFDCWGDAVNTASRMESNGQPMRLHISADTHSIVDGEFECEAREAIQVKGKGEMMTYFVLSERPEARTRSYLCLNANELRTQELASAIRTARQEMELDVLNVRIRSFTEGVKKRTKEVRHKRRARPSASHGSASRRTMRATMAQPASSYGRMSDSDASE